MNYKDSGVDIEEGNAFVQRLKQKVPSIGGFNGMFDIPLGYDCLLYTSPSPRDGLLSRMPSSA